MNTGLLTLQICLLHILTATETNLRAMIVIQSCLKTTVNHPLEKAREKKKKAEYDGKERESPYIYMLTKTLQLTGQVGLAIKYLGNYSPIKYLGSDSTLFCRYCFSLYTRSGFEFTSDACTCRLIMRAPGGGFLSPDSNSSPRKENINQLDGTLFYYSMLLEQG